MLGVYFSGTGNTKFCVEKFIEIYGGEIVSIEDEGVTDKINQSNKLVFAYPVQYSNLPKIVRDFIVHNKDLWKDKNIFIIATMGLFSGDGAGLAARLFKKYGADIIGGLHLKMPDSVCDVKALKRPLEVNKESVRLSVEKIENSAAALKKGRSSKDGLGLLYHLAGLFGQRLYFYNKTRKYSNKLKISSDCIGCGKCANLCPMKNIKIENKLAVPNDRCTMCYRCISKCPVKAITLIGKEVIEQCGIERYL